MFISHASCFLISQNNTFYKVCEQNLNNNNVLNNQCLCFVNNSFINNCCYLSGTMTKMFLVSKNTIVELQMTYWIWSGLLRLAWRSKCTHTESFTADYIAMGTTERPVLLARHSLLLGVPAESWDRVLASWGFAGTVSCGVMLVLSSLLP